MVDYLTFDEMQEKPGNEREILFQFKAFASSPVIKYQIYALEIKNEYEKDTVNMQHVCSIWYNRAMKLNENLGSSGHVVFSKMKVEKSKNYLINVIITDPKGRMNTCKTPLYLTQLKAPIKISSPFEINPFSVVISIVCLQIVAYLMIGMLIKKLVYKSKGIDLIPNIQFWKNMPVFLLNISSFILSLCKGSKKLEENKNETIE